MQKIGRFTGYEKNIMKMSFEEYGVGQPIVLLHAFLLSHSMWQGLIEPLIAENWRVILSNFPGFGNSPLDSEISRMEDLAQSVRVLLSELSELNVKKVVIGDLSIVGHNSKIESLFQSRTT